MEMLKKYFYGELPPSEEQQVQQWLAEHGDDPQVVEALDKLMGEQENADERLSAQAFDSVKKKLGIKHNKISKYVVTALKWMSVAACFILLPFFSALVHESRQCDVKWMEIKVPNGTYRELHLADGTHLHLNAGTRVTYPSDFNSKERKIFVDGEVFAEVTKNPECPFVIVSGDVSVNVYGTTFNFKSYSESECVELLLLDGAVTMDIDTPCCSKELSLHPGEMIQFDRSTGEIDLKPFTPHLYRGFHEGRALHFFNIGLRDIAMDLERYFGTKVVLLDESLAENRYFALFTNNETLEQILEGINMDGKMKYSSKNGVIYISKK